MTAYKNSGIRTEPNRKQALLFGSMVLMIASLLISRGALSVSTILFLVLAIVHKDFRQQWKTFLSTPFLVVFTLLFLIPFVSGLWSDNLSKWSDVVRLKLPLLFFPLAVAGSWQFTRRQWTFLAWAFVAVTAVGCVWSLLHYAQNRELINEGYLRAKTLQTPLEHDHVRFSWMVSIAAMTCFLLGTSAAKNGERIVLWLLFFFLGAYLFVLAARTGLLSLFIFGLFYAAWYLSRKNSWKTAVLTGAVLILLPVLAYFTIPTFQNRIRYLVYDFSFVQKAEYLPGANDGARVMSLKAGWQVLRQHPFGVGAGDVMHEADKWYAAHVPDVLATDKFYPSSEWLLYGAFAGWIGVAAFSVVMLFPFFTQVRQHKVFWLAFHATAAFSFAYDMGLEVQYGIFLYAFVACWWWKWLRT